MRTKLEEVESYENEIAIIRAVKLTEEIRCAIDMLESNRSMIPVIEKNQITMCPTTAIYYIESVEKKTYIYTKENCFETKYRLYELEDVLNNNFFRCSKSMIVNIRKIKSVQAEINGRMIARLLNDERIIIARNYVKKLKERLGI